MGYRFEQDFILPENYNKSTDEGKKFHTSAYGSFCINYINSLIKVFELKEEIVEVEDPKDSKKLVSAVRFSVNIPLKQELIDRSKKTKEKHHDLPKPIKPSIEGR